jgi:uncharacterized damage-inducible protein DinB
MKSTLRFVAVLCALVAAAPVMRAQATAEKKPPTVAQILNAFYGYTEQEVVSAAEAMPEEKYSFAPTNGEFKGVRTFGEEVRHIAAANHLFFGPLMGEKIDPKMAMENRNGPENLKTKAEMVQYLKDSFALGHRALATFTPENLAEPLPNPVFPFLANRLILAQLGSSHAMDHYGQMVEYLRMNGIVPPSTQQEQKEEQRQQQQKKDAAH